MLRFLILQFYFIIGPLLSYNSASADESREYIFRQGRSSEWHIDSSYIKFRAIILLDKGYEKDIDFVREVTSVFFECDYKEKTVLITYGPHPESNSLDFVNSKIIFINNQTAGTLKVEMNGANIFIRESENKEYFLNFLDAFLQFGNVLMVHDNGKFAFKKARFFINSSSREPALNAIKTSCGARR
jgi:hypothetical protein